MWAGEGKGGDLIWDSLKIPFVPFSPSFLIPSSAKGKNLRFARVEIKLYSLENNVIRNHNIFPRRR